MKKISFIKKLYGDVPDFEREDVLKSKTFFEGLEILGLEKEDFKINIDNNMITFCSSVIDIDRSNRVHYLYFVPTQDVEDIKPLFSKDIRGIWTFHIHQDRIKMENIDFKKLKGKDFFEELKVLDFIITDFSTFANEKMNSISLECNVRLEDNQDYTVSYKVSDTVNDVYDWSPFEDEKFNGTWCIEKIE